MNKKNINYALSSDDLYKILENKTNIIDYKLLYNINNIDEVIKHGSCIILYTTGNENGVSFGHWCCILTDEKKNKIEFFDPYGFLIDTEIKKFIDTDYGHKNYKGNQLAKLIYNSKYKNIEYNNHKLQNFKKGINTCGRHCASRILFNDLNLNHYIKLIKNLGYKIPDQFVLDLTNILI